jgi:hypothetical protein
LSSLFNQLNDLRCIPFACFVKIDDFFFHNFSPLQKWHHDAVCERSYKLCQLNRRGIADERFSSYQFSIGKSNEDLPISFVTPISRSFLPEVVIKKKRRLNKGAAGEKIYTGDIVAEEWHLT